MRLNINYLAWRAEKRKRGTDSAAIWIIRDSPTVCLSAKSDKVGSAHQEVEQPPTKWRERLGPPRRLNTPELFRSFSTSMLQLRLNAFRSL